MPEKQRASKIDHVADLAVPVSVILAEKSFSLDHILELRPGSILDFERRQREPLDLCVNGSRVGRGRAVDVGDRLAFLVEEVEAPPAEDPGSAVS